jgi:hypothetical protein
MGTATIPFSNPAGNNQTNPTSTAKPVAVAGTAMPGATGASAAVNPYVAPASTVASVPTSGGSGGDLGKQLTDIYGSGVGGALSSELGSMSGTNSAILQEYKASLAPQMATAQANVNAALGAGGVSSNSSVAAIADANLQAQETAAISGESAQLTEHDQDLTANILGSTMGAAEKETASSGWTVFGDVMGAISQDAGAILHGGAGATNTSPMGSSTGNSGNSANVGSMLSTETRADTNSIGAPETEGVSDLGSISL